VAAVVVAVVVAVVAAVVVAAVAVVMDWTRRRATHREVNRHRGHRCCNQAHQPLRYLPGQVLSYTRDL
jgi:ABC-type Fe3+ transport system permease subunit